MRLRSPMSFHQLRRRTAWIPRAPKVLHIVCDNTNINTSAYRIAGYLGDSDIELAVECRADLFLLPPIVPVLVCGLRRVSE